MKAHLAILIIALVAAAVGACGDVTSAHAAVDLSASPADCGLCGRLPPDLKQGD